MADANRALPEGHAALPNCAPDGRTALYRERAVSIRAAAHLHRVPVTIVSLPRKVAGRMAIHAARVTEDGNDRFESRGSRSIVAFIFLLFMALSGDLKQQTTDKAEHASSTDYDPREFSPCDLKQ
jgi:hypothetical protein